jgi:NitT/TauT family transport system substrate-binding protein
MTKTMKRFVALMSFVALTTVAAPAMAQDAPKQDKLKIAVGQRGVWENSVSELGQDAGIFKKHGLTLEVLYTQGGGETQQAVISGSVDIGIGVGTDGVMGAFSKGAPIRVLGATMRGYYEFWYVPSTSPLKTLKDADGKTIAYSTNGSSTNMMVLAFAKMAGVTLKPVATGSPPQTFTQVMTGQVDIGWTAPPLMLDALDSGRIRVLASGDEVPEFRNQPVRVIVANLGSLEKNRDAFTRYMAAYRETIEWLWSSPDAIKAYAKWAEVPESIAIRTRDEFVKKDRADPDRVEGIADMMGDAVKFKFLAAPLTKEQLATLVQLQPTK